jgi:hypothetical protein
MTSSPQLLRISEGLRYWWHIFFSVLFTTHLYYDTQKKDSHIPGEERIYFYLPHINQIINVGYADCR